MAGYVITGDLATFTTDTEAGRMKVTFFKGSPVPAGVPEKEIVHHLSVGLIEAVRGAAVEPLPPVLVDGGDGEGEGDAAILPAERMEARAKLPADGSAPDGRASKAVWVEYAVRDGYDFEAANAMEKADIIAMFKD